MEQRSGSLGQYRKWAGASPDQAYSVRAVGSHPKGNQPYIGEVQPTHWTSNPSNANTISGQNVSQMMGLQVRMMQARQQNAIAHQRVADRLLQNKQYGSYDSNDSYQNKQYDSYRSGDGIIEHGLSNSGMSPTRELLARERSKRDSLVAQLETAPFPSPYTSPVPSRKNTEEQVPQQLSPFQKRNAARTNTDKQVSPTSYQEKTSPLRRSTEKQIPQVVPKDLIRSAESSVSPSPDDSDEDMPETPLYQPPPEKNTANRKRSEPVPTRKKSEPVEKRTEKYETQEKEDKFQQPAPPPVPVKKETKEIKPKRVAENQPASPTPPKPNPYIEEMSLLAADITKIIDANVLTLGETMETRKVREYEKSDEVVGERRRKLRELLAIRDDDAVVRIPMWKHKLVGDFNPPEDTVLKGRQLFQVIVWSMIVMFIKPQLAIRKRKTEGRDRERSDLARTLMLYADATKSWIGKGVRFPVATLEQDATLDFDPKPHPLDRQISGFNYRMMQLKVRVKNIVKCVSSMEMPPDNITDFLVGLVEEGNYFPPEFLWNCETEKLEFNSLGGVMRLIIPIHDINDTDENEKEKTFRKQQSEKVSARGFDSSPFDAYDAKNEKKATDKNEKNDKNNKNDKYKNDKNVITLPERPDKLLDVARVRMLLQNFLLIRILIGHVLLSPWSCSICRKPTKRKARIVYNCRMTATLVYEIVQMIDAVSTLPPVGGKSRTSGIGKANKLLGNMFSSKTRSAKKSLTDKIMKAESSDRLSDADFQPQSKVILLFERIFGIQSSQDEIDDRMERPRLEVEEQLLANRKYYEPLPILHGYLLKPATLNAARPLIEEWLAGCSLELDEWMSKLVLHVMSRRAYNYAQTKGKKS